MAPAAWQKDYEILFSDGQWVTVSGTAVVVVTPRPELAAWRTGSAWRRPTDPALITLLVAAGTSSADNGQFEPGSAGS